MDRDREDKIKKSSQDDADLRTHMKKRASNKRKAKKVKVKTTRRRRPSTAELFDTEDQDGHGKWPASQNVNITVTRGGAELCEYERILLMKMDVLEERLLKLELALMKIIAEDLNATDPTNGTLIFSNIKLKARMLKQTTDASQSFVKKSSGLSLNDTIAKLTDILFEGKFSKSSTNDTENASNENENENDSNDVNDEIASTIDPETISTNRKPYYHDGYNLLPKTNKKPKILRRCRRGNLENCNYVEYQTTVNPIMLYFICAFLISMLRSMRIIVSFYVCPIIDDWRDALRRRLPANIKRTLFRYNVRF